MHRYLRNPVIRFLRHWWLDEKAARKLIPYEMAKRIEERIAASEKRHSGEIKVVIEGGLPLHYLWQGISSRQRAQRLFGELGIWDTEERNGVLIYLLLADHAIEIVADRGLSKRIEAETWFAMVERLGQTLSMKDPETGLTEALAEISALQMQHFEKSVNQRDFDELCNLVLYL